MNEIREPPGLHEVRALALKLFASATSDQSASKWMRWSAMMPLQPTVHYFRIWSTAWGLDRLPVGVEVGGGLGGGGAKGSCDCELLMRAPFCAFFDGSFCKLVRS